MLKLTQEKSWEADIFGRAHGALGGNEPRDARVIYPESAAGRMGYGGGAPSWVYKNRIVRLEGELRSASGRSDSVLHDEIDKLRQRIKELESENAELKRGLEEYRNRLPR